MGGGQPSGTVTLVFTDIEGSTRLLHELGQDAYREALTEHRRVVRDAFAEGYEVDYEGDAFFYAFGSAQEAVDAVQAAMDGLEGGPIRIRVGIHTGEPGLDPPKYVGLDVHKAARIMAAGHGGQVLLSDPTRALLESGLELVDLGEHRLKDLDGALWLFQLGAVRFPPLRSLNNSNLPSPASSFRGRQAELAEANELLASSRLLTVTGPGGIGKTRFAIELARRQLDRCPNGVFWVGLAPLRDADLVLPTVAQSLGAKGELQEHIADKRMLLLLDNTEHVLDSAPALANLLEACPNLTLLVTSRALLRLRAETDYPLAALEQAAAVELFCERARVEPDDAVAELCQRLDQLPLALELAAARTRILTPRQLLDRLEHRLDLLKGGRDAEERQQTLRATIEWSYNLLDQDEQTLFARLGVFAGGCTLEAAAAICDADLDALQSLVEKSLVRKTNDRFWLLETIREYADERLGAYGEIDPLHRRHADWFLEQAQRLWASSGRPTHARMAEELALDQHNLAAGTLWALDAGEAELALAYGEALWEFWHIRGQGGEGVRLLTSIVENSEGVASSARAWSLFGLGVLKRARGDFEAAFALHQQSLELFRALGDRAGQSAALLDCGVDLTNAGDAAAAESHFAQALAAAREAGDERILGYALNNFAWLLSREPGRDNEAFELVTEGIDRLGAVGDRWGVACAVGTLADLHLKRGELDEPERLFRQQLAAGAEFRSIVVIAEALRGLACIATRRDQLPDAARLFGHADQLLQDAELDTGGTIDDAAERETARAGLGVDEYEALRAQGGGLGLDELVPASVGAQ